MIHRRGSALLWTLVVLTALIGFCSFAVDYGRVQVVKSELQRTADAAARYASQVVGQGTAAVRARAKDAADDNTADGTPVILADADIEFGLWSAATRTFQLNGTPTNAVRITARREGATAVPLTFARIFGRQSFDVSASAIALSPHMTVGFMGLTGIEFHNNSFVGSYDSTSVTRPLPGHSTGKGVLASNGAITAHNSLQLDGNVTLGPSGAVSGVQVGGTTTRLSAAIDAPTIPAAGTGANPLGLAANYTVNSPTTLPAGTYRFTSLTLNADLSFSGVAVVYVAGNVLVNNSNKITAHQSRPTNLTIYQTGTGRTFYAQNNIDITATIIAPGSNFTANNMLYFYGTAVFRHIDVKNSAEVFVDSRVVIASPGQLVR